MNRRYDAEIQDRHQPISLDQRVPDHFEYNFELIWSENKNRLQIT